MLLRKWLRMWWVGWLLNRWCLLVGSNPPCFSHLALLIHWTPFRLHSCLGRPSKPKGYSKTYSDTEHGLSFPELQPSSIQMIIYPEIMDICLLWWWLNGAQICSRTFWGTHQDSIGRAEGSTLQYSVHITAPGSAEIPSPRGAVGPTAWMPFLLTGKRGPHLLTVSGVPSQPSSPTGFCWHWNAMAVVYLLSSNWPPYCLAKARLIVFQFIYFTNPRQVYPLKTLIFN